MGTNSGTRAPVGVVKIIRKAMIMPLTWAQTVGAGEGNRTLMTSLEGWRSAIELRPRARREPLDGPPGRHRQRTGCGTLAPNREGRHFDHAAAHGRGSRSGLRGTVGYVRS
ncbi:MAG: hypothetical protein QOJ73_943 [Streptosporangiaceae bacterium]|jgi:hypothetical protein|nr:hypothetical protein [Streptosporangiaceae bacterium]